MFVEELLGFVDLRRQIRAAAAIGVVEEHKLTVLRAHLVLVQGAFPMGCQSALPVYRPSTGEPSGVTYGSSRIKEASRRVIRASNPLFQW